MTEELEEICKWDIKISKGDWTKFKAGINDVVKRHGKIPTKGTCIGEGFELHAEANEESNYVSMALSIKAGRITPLLLIMQLREYITNNIQNLIEYQENYRKFS